MRARYTAGICSNGVADWRQPKPNCGLQQTWVLLLRAQALLTFRCVVQAQALIPTNGSRKAASDGNSLAIRKTGSSCQEAGDREKAQALFRRGCGKG